MSVTYMWQVIRERTPDNTGCRQRDTLAFMSSIIGSLAGATGFSPSADIGGEHLPGKENVGYGVA